MSFIIKDNDIYSMIILWLNLFVYNLKLDISFFHPFHIISMVFYVEQGVLTMVINM